MPGPYPLATLAVEIDRAGIAGPSFIDVLLSLRAAYQQIYGTDTYLAEDTADGQWLAVQAQGFYDVNSALIAGYLSYSPSFAQGAGLSSLVKINGLRRQTPSRSTAPVTLVGQAYTEINGGVVADRANNLWDLPASVVIPAAGEITVTATARDAGAIAAAEGAINRIFTLQPGWQSAINRTPATIGFPLETDATLRKRQAVSTSLPAITPLLAIWGAIANVRGVGRSKVYENDTDQYDLNGLPPHSIAVVVAGGDDEAIAQTIAHKKNTGCGTYGTTEIIVYEPPAAPLTVNFFRLREIQIYVAIWIRPLEGYLNSTGQLIRWAVEAFVNQLDIGQAVFAAWLCTPASLQGEAATSSSGRTQAELDRLRATYVLDQILLGTAPEAIDQHEIVIPFNAAAATTLDNISITLET